MPEPEEKTPATVPTQPAASAPIKKGMPVVWILGGVLVLIALSNAASLFSGHQKPATRSALPFRPSTANPQQVSSFETQQTLQAKRDTDERARQQQVADQMQQLQNEQAVPGPEADGAAPMTPAHKQAIYGNSPNAPRQTSNVSQAQAEAKQRQLAREKQHQDALNSDTVAIDFAHGGNAPTVRSPESETEAAAQPASVETGSGGGIGTNADTGTGSAAADSQNATAEQRPDPTRKADPMAPYVFDAYQGRLYRVFEGTVLEGIVTNHVDGGYTGPVLIMLSTDYYSHDHQQLLMPQGTRLIGSVQSVGSGQQRKLFVTFHRAVCPDGFSLDFDKYIGLDPLGTTGLATKVDHGYLQAFGAAAAIGGLGGLAQIGNGGSILSPTAQIQNGISSQSALEGEQVLNHFLNRLPIITLKEGSRARVYIGRDILIPSYAEHRVDPNL